MTATSLPSVHHAQGHFGFLVCVLLLCWSVLKVANAQLTLTANVTYLEEQPAGSRVGDIRTASGLPAIAGDDLDLLEFSVQSDEFFTIDKVRGILSSSIVIDRDERCAGEAQCIIPVEVVVYKVTANNAELFKIIQVEVYILDKNDNPPTFPARFVTLEVAENNLLDEELSTSAAEDLDVGTNGLHKDSYSFKDSTKTFVLKVHQKEDGSTSLGIVIKEHLDRERRDSYQVEIIARDGGQIPRSGSVLVNITVTDRNDNAPVFSMSSYNTSVLEDQNINEAIMRVEATDLDSGPNAEISYRISSQVSADIRRIFYIDEQTGELFTQAPLDFETDPMFQLIVEAVDHGSPSLSNRAKVKIYVTDVNDNSPQINVNFIPPGRNMSELAPLGKFIATVEVSDRDQGENKRVACSLDDGHFSLEEMNGLYKLVLARHLDHEKSSNHRVTITCSDHGQPRRTNSTTFVVNVLDENDEHPIFEKETYFGSIRENQAGTSSVLTVKAHDLDSGEMGRITYSLEDRYNGLFVINPDTGVISVTRSVDREGEAASFEFHVMARDNGEGRLANSSLVVVEVQDENDEPPHFTRPTFYGEVLENKPAGTLVGNVTATDPDSAVHSKIRYAILQQGTDFEKFRIDSGTGEVKSATVFDREQKDRYYLTIQAVDPENADFYSTCNFTIRILDDNDHYPVISGIRNGVNDNDDASGNVNDGDSNNITLIVQYTAPVGSAITQVLAYDGDAIGSKNAQLYYDIIAGDPEHLFSINRFDGALSLARAVKAEDIKTFKLTITVMDGGDPPKADSQDIYVKVNGSIAALAEASSGGISQNILIVVILIGVTVLLALAILAAICLLRKVDRQRRANRASQKLSEDKMYQLTAQQGGLSNHSNIYTNRGHPQKEDGSRDGRPVGVASSNSFSNNLSKRGGGVIGNGGVGGTKKEVSFSLDEESDCHNSSAGSAHPLTSFKGGGEASGDRADGMKAGGSRPVRNGVMNIPVAADKGSTSRRSPQNEECQLIEILKKSAEDALSESSGETDPSDSGRGGSEDEYSHRGSGLDPEHQQNGRYPRAKPHRSPSNLNDKEQNQQHQHPNNNNNSNISGGRGSKLPPAGPSRQLSSASTASGTPSMNNGRPRSRLLDSAYPRENPRDSYTSDFGSEFSGSGPPSHGRTDSDRSVPPPPAPRPAGDSPINQMLPFTRPAPIPSSHAHSTSPTSLRELQNNHHNMGYTLPSHRSLLTRDSPNRLAGPQDGHITNISNNNLYNSNSLLRAYNSHRSIPTRQQADHAPNLSSVSFERLPRSTSLSSTSSHPLYYSDRAAGGGGFYPSIPERWDRNSSGLGMEEDDRTTTSGSYTINTDDLRPDMDDIGLHDSVV